MTGKMRRFADLYAKLANGRQAAIDAGYPEANAHVMASRLIRHPEVAAYLATKTLRREIAGEVTHGNLINLTKYALQELAKEDVKLDPAARSRAIETARRCLDTLTHVQGLRTAKVEHTGNVEHTHSLADLARKAREYQEKTERIEKIECEVIETLETTVTEREEQGDSKPMA